ncbi:MAG: Gldg family protein, partial [Bacteroidetes bacterium]|nr:Gldg family protein [Bacteroidota bacterium]
LRPEQNRYVMQLKYKGRSTFLRLFDDQVIFPTETETNAALKRLLRAKMPRIAFVQGEQERSINKIGDRHYKVLTNYIPFRRSLVNQGFDVETIFPREQEIPKDLTALVIADPKMPFDAVSISRIRQYIEEGGNLLIAGEPGRQDLLAPLLQPLGVTLTDGMVVQQSSNFSPDLVQSLLTPAAGAMTRRLKQEMEDSATVTMPGTAALSFNTGSPFTITPLITTPERISWNKKIRPKQDEIESAESEETANDGLYIPRQVVNRGNAALQIDPWKGLRFMPETGDLPGPLPVMAALTRTINGRQQRIVISGDADFLANAELARNNIMTCNFDLTTGIFSWFSYGEFPIDSFRPRSKDNRLRLTAKSLRTENIILVAVLPGLLLIGGIVLLIRRKRK